MAYALKYVSNGAPTKTVKVFDNKSDSIESAVDSSEDRYLDGQYWVHDCGNGGVMEIDNLVAIVIQGTVFRKEDKILEGLSVTTKDQALG